MFARLSDRQLNFLVVVNALVIAVAVVLAGDTFLSLYNFQSMSAQVPELALLALGVMLAMIAGSGGIDLSGIALANLSGIVSYLLIRDWVSADDLPLTFVWLFAGIALLVGLVGGMINGALVAFVGLTPIIATLGTQLFFTGIAVLITNGSAVSLGYIEPLDDFGNTPVLGVPMCFALFIAIAVILGVVLRYTPFGLKLYLMGSNAKAARYAGIPNRRMLFVIYTICGVLASIAGIIIAARTSSVKWDYGTSYVLIAILIVVMAGVRPEGGYGRIICVVLSATALQMLSSLFNFIDISNFFRDCAWGLLLLIFLATSRFDVRSFLPLRS
ncbi:ABC transporter permease [Phyllobacterium sp. 0TCS1.6C]|uniref:ABC transporter permease n=1 Tax=Phyllobacterium sp. 0TCS1.6C TaxID=2995638 RepID=UPI0022649539|nr:MULTISPECIES: ABC transporter permease [unclassified Phyllobacterium]MCX8278982.1 ABC transporter permease [Phyllobacterium sp. 0TCS1.6C]MCX8293766.1 ABC transporter permease [Phyllobacterium sp. 0TCS1.6A]